MFLDIYIQYALCAIRKLFYAIHYTYAWEKHNTYKN